MNTTPNRNSWGVTEQALEEALPTIKGSPIGMGKNYQLGHHPDEDSMNSGEFKHYIKPGSYALATAHITDTKTWEMMKAGELGPVSVVIDVYKESCSVCGEDLQELQSHWREHECIKTGKAHSLISSFKFHRVDFVDTPAYPQAGVLEMSAQAQAQAQASPAENYRLFANFYQSQSQSQGVQNNKNKPNLTGEKKTLSNNTIAELETANQTLRAELDATKKQADTNAQKATELQAQLDAIQKAAHDALVTEVHEARKTAELADKDETKEKQMLTACTTEFLKILKTDAQKTAAKLTTITEKPPKTQYQASNSNHSYSETNQYQEKLAEATKTVRAELGITQLKETQ